MDILKNLLQKIQHISKELKLLVLDQRSKLLLLESYVSRRMCSSATLKTSKIWLTLSKSLKESGILVKHAAEDADLLTALTGIEYAKSIKTIVIGEDTDILVLLWHYNELGTFPLIYQTSNRCWDIHHLTEMTGNIKEAVLLQHAFLVCDTVSRIFGIGKNKIMNNSHLIIAFEEAAKTFYSLNSTREEIENAGLHTFTAVYNRKKFTCLNKLGQNNIFSGCQFLCSNNFKNKNNWQVYKLFYTQMFIISTFAHIIPPILD